MCILEMKEDSKFMSFIVQSKIEEEQLKRT